MDYNAAAVQALGAVDHCGRCSSDGGRRGFAVHKGLGMRVVVAEREQVLEVRDENAVMVGLNSQGRSQMEARQAESTAIA